MVFLPRFLGRLEPLVDARQHPPSDVDPARVRRVVGAWVPRRFQQPSRHVLAAHRSLVDGVAQLLDGLLQLVDLGRCQLRRGLHSGALKPRLLSG
mgnify:CR=1 FL=1